MKSFANQSYFRPIIVCDEKGTFHFVRDIQMPTIRRLSQQQCNVYQDQIREREATAKTSIEPTETIVGKRRATTSIINLYIVSRT